MFKYRWSRVPFINQWMIHHWWLFLHSVLILIYGRIERALKFEVVFFIFWFNTFQVNIILKQPLQLFAIFMLVIIMSKLFLLLIVIENKTIRILILPKIAIIKIILIKTIQEIGNWVGLISINFLILSRVLVN